MRSSHEQSQAHRCGDDGDDRDLPDLDVADGYGPVELCQRGGGLPERAEPEQRDALEQERDRERRDQHDRRRLRAQRSKDDALHRQRQPRTTAKQSAIPTATGPPTLEGEREREPAGHDQLAVREVHEAQDAEDETDADGHEREDRAEADRVDLDLKIDGVAEEVARDRSRARS